MRLLLDSNIVIPIARRERERLDARVNLLLDVSVNEIFVSIASLWEIAIKSRLGKLPLKVPIQELPDVLTGLGCTLLHVDEHHAVEGLLDQPDTKDPFDRMLLAQCQVEGMRLVTTDRTLAEHSLSWRPA